MKSKFQKNVVSLDTSNFSAEQLELLESLVDRQGMPCYISEKEGMQIVGKILKRLRIKMGMTQAAMAEEVGYPHLQFISNIERGAAKIPRERTGDFVIAYGADEYLCPAILKLIHQDEWSNILSMVQLAGADSPAFDHAVDVWISKNR